MAQGRRVAGGSRRKTRVDQVVQLVGAVLILTGFVLSQQGRLATDAALYLVLNAAGAAVLTVTAVADGDLGFTLLEGTWTIVSTVGLVRLLMRKAA